MAGAGTAGERNKSMPTVIHRQKAKAKEDIGVNLRTTEAEIVELVTEGYFLDREIKKKEERKSALRVMLIEEAKGRKVKALDGTDCYAAFGDSEPTLPIDVRKFLALVKKLGKEKLIDVMVSVKITEAKKYLGEAALEGLLKKGEKVEWSSLSYKDGQAPLNKR